MWTSRIIQSLTSLIIKRRQGKVNIFYTKIHLISKWIQVWLNLNSHKRLNTLNYFHQFCIPQKYDFIAEKINNSYISLKKLYFQLLISNSGQFVFFTNNPENYWKRYPSKYYEQTLKVNKFQNEFIKSTFIPKYEQNPYNFWFIFWEKRWLH